jgi:hypothetical protein
MVTKPLPSVPESSFRRAAAARVALEHDEAAGGQGGRVVWRQSPSVEAAWRATSP